MLKPVLIFAYGNLSRGDDALGPLLLEHLETSAAHLLHSVEILTDFQLQIEHALDLENRDLVLFVDASVKAQYTYDFIELEPAADHTYTTHAMSPAAVLAVYQTIKKQMPPPCFLLSIKGTHFELGEGLSAEAALHLQQAARFAEQLLSQPTVATWRQAVFLLNSKR